MSESQLVPVVRRGVSGRLPKEVETSLLRMQKLPDVRHVAVMPDVHLARDVCVGTVLATTRLVYPGAVGGDIGCGMSAVAFDAGADLLADAGAAGRLMDALRAGVPSNRLRTAAELPA